MLTRSTRMLSFMSGPQEGIYLIHPDQMKVLYPANADDVDITDLRVTTQEFGGPFSEMTYSIGKIWFSTMVRDIVDTANKSGQQLEEFEYDQILAIDQKFNTTFAELPYYYKFDEVSRRMSYDLEQSRPYIVWQRHLIHFGYHTRLSRIHRPYLTKGYRDPQYAYSRMICLRSARAVIEIEGSMREVATGFSPDPSRLWIIVHHVFTSTVILVMDYCCHRDDPQAAERKQEIMNCYKILEKSQEQSSIARNGLAHLKSIMTKWRLKSDLDRPGTTGNGNRNGNGNGDGNGNGNGNKNGSGGGGGSGQVNGQGPSQTQSRPQAHGPAQMTYGEQDQLNTAAAESSMPEGDPMMFEGMDMGIDVMQDLWLHSFSFDTSGFDVQWDDLFRDLDRQPGIFG
jgi:hypothetical protein